MTEREVMRLLKGVHELEMQEMEERLARERVACVPLLRARELVLDPGRWTKEEREHVSGCRRCTRLLERAERTISHPPWWTLLRWTLKKLTGEEAQAMRWHMEDGQCQRCLRLTESGLFRALVALVEAGPQTREQVQALEDAARLEA